MVHVNKPDDKFSVVPDKKYQDVKAWFIEHFKSTDRKDYIRRSPFVILSGPTGCGKTTTLKRIAEELDLSIKEYSETTDTSLIQFELRNSRDINRDDSSNSNTTLTIDRRRSHIFESFVINHVRYETLYGDDDQKSQAAFVDNDAADEFDDDEDFILPPELSHPRRPAVKPEPKGVIIHIESPLTFGRSAPVLIQCLRRLKKTIKEISRQCPRRVAIVFEAVEDHDYVMALSYAVRLSLDIQVFKINPVTRINMKKFIEREMREYSLQIYLDKNNIEQLIDDSNGDVSACKNTLYLHCRSIDADKLVEEGYKDEKLAADIEQEYQMLMGKPITPIQANKRQKIEHHGPKRLYIHPKLMRDISRGSGFFHILGKIFYQRRYYTEDAVRRRPRKIDRPYDAENTTEFLVDQVDSDAKKLNAWLHQNYSKYCGNDELEKAALFMDNLSFVDTMSLDSTLSTQYYESHQSIDHVQKHVAIEATVFSLYQDNSGASKKSNDKKIKTESGEILLLRSSVEYNQQLKVDGTYQGFAKPAGLMISKVSSDHQALLDRYSTMMTQKFGRPYDQTDLLLDYAPYTSILLENSSLNYNGDDHLPAITSELQKIEEPDDVEYDLRHETLLELIDRCDSQKVKQGDEDVSMDEG